MRLHVRTPSLVGTLEGINSEHEYEGINSDHHLKKRWGNLYEIRVGDKK